jgi:hypothetical protein
MNIFRTLFFMAKFKISNPPHNSRLAIFQSFFILNEIYDHHTMFDIMNTDVK